MTLSTQPEGTNAVLVMQSDKQTIPLQRKLTRCMRRWWMPSRACLTSTSISPLDGRRKSCGSIKLKKVFQAACEPSDSASSLVVIYFGVMRRAAGCTNAWHQLLLHIHFSLYEIMCNISLRLSFCWREPHIWEMQIKRPAGVL